MVILFDCVQIFVRGGNFAALVTGTDCIRLGGSVGDI